MDGTAEGDRDAGVLRAIPTLETINKTPVREFWSGIDARAR
jgi:hypothetical protein